MLAVINKKVQCSGRENRPSARTAPTGSPVIVERSFLECHVTDRSGDEEPWEGDANTDVKGGRGEIGDDQVAL